MGILTQAKLSDGTTRFASIISVNKKVSYISTRHNAEEGKSRRVVVEEEAAISTSLFPLAFVTPKLVIQYAPGLSKRRTSFVEIVDELLACPTLMEAHKDEFSPGFLQIIDNHCLLFDHYVMRSLLFLRIPILVLMEQSEKPSTGSTEVPSWQNLSAVNIGEVRSLVSRSVEHKYFVLERRDGKRFVIEPTDTGFIYWDHYNPTRIKDPNFKFEDDKPYQVKPTKGGPPVNYIMRDAHMREIEANVTTDDGGPPDHPNLQPTAFRDARDKVPSPPQANKLITPEDEASYGIELIDFAKRAAKDAMAPELNAIKQEALSWLVPMAANDACSVSSLQSSARLITSEDEEDYGTELIDLARRAAYDAIAPELNALRYEVRIKIAAISASSADFLNFAQLHAPPRQITSEDKENYGEDLICLAKRAAKEAMDPELTALRQELLSLMKRKRSAIFTVNGFRPHFGAEKERAGLLLL
jgi:hypothetical protein